MKRQRLNSQSRTYLDEKLRDIGRSSQFQTPVRGWIKAIREALGMSTAQLAARLKVSQPSVVSLEQSEAKGTMELATLRRVADALDCDVVYALIPRQPLESQVRERARRLAERRLAAVGQSMLLEDQAVSSTISEARIDELLRETNPRLLWE